MLVFSRLNFGLQIPLNYHAHQVYPLMGPFYLSIQYLVYLAKLKTETNQIPMSKAYIPTRKDRTGGVTMHHRIFTVSTSSLELTSRSWLSEI